MGDPYCVTCREDWPCSTVRLLVALDAAEAEVERWGMTE